MMKSLVTLTRQLMGTVTTGQMELEQYALLQHQVGERGTYVRRCYGGGQGVQPISLVFVQSLELLSRVELTSREML